MRQVALCGRWWLLLLLILPITVGLGVTDVHSLAGPADQVTAHPTGIPPTAFALTAVAQRRDPAAAGLDEPWPPFTMIFSERTTDIRPSRGSRTQRISVDYARRRLWTVTLLEDSAAPATVGWTYTFDGQTTVQKRPGFPEITTRWEPGELTVPANWLVPGGIDGLIKTRGYTSRAIGDGLAV